MVEDNRIMGLTMIKRTRPATVVAPVEAQTPSTATRISRRQPRPSQELTEALEVIAATPAPRRRRSGPAAPEPVLIPATAVEEDKGPRVDYDAIIEKYRREATTPKKAIRAKCVECMGGMIAEIRRCTSESTCASWPFRLGENPFHKLSKHNKGTDDEG